MSPSSPARLTTTTTGAALLVTATAVLLPFLHLAYEAPVLHVVLETAEAMIALLVAYLLYGRYLRRGRARTLLVTYALVLVAVANLLLTALPGALPLERELTPWAPLSVRLLGVLLLAVASVTPVPATISRGSARLGLAGCAVTVLLVAALALTHGDRLPPAVDPALDLGDLNTPIIGGHPVALAAQVLAGLLYALAAVAFTRQAAREDDELQRWLGAGCALAAVARVNYLLFPSLYSEYVTLGDLMRLGFYAFLLVGALREVRSYWESLSYTAVLEDRRRLARDLHDGLTQELAYIWSQSRLLVRTPGDVEAAERISGAAERALDEARTAIAALTRTTTGSFADVLVTSVEGLAGRYGAQARVEVDDRVELAPEQGDAVLRIVAEAFRNAVRHGGAHLVTVSLTCPPLRLLVRDDGQGFEGRPSNSSGSGFGLTSMRERAEGLGATFELQSAAGKGTTVEVRWPWTR